MRYRQSKQNSNYCLPIVLGFFVTAGGGTNTEMQHCGLEVGNTDHTKIAKGNVCLYYFRSFSNVSIEYRHYMRLFRKFRSRKPVKYSLLVKIFPQLLKVQTMTFMRLKQKHAIVYNVSGIYQLRVN